MIRYMFAASLLAVPFMLPAQGKIDMPVPLPELEKRVKADSNDPAAHYNVALGYWSAKRWDDAERELRTAVKLEPRFAAAHLALSGLPLARNPHLYDKLDRTMKELPKDVKQAEDQRVHEYRHAFLIDPMVDMRIIAVGDEAPDTWTIRDELGSALADYIAGITSCEEGKYADCENNLTSFMQAFGNNKYNKKYIPATAIWFHGIAAAHMQHYDAAIKDFRTLIDRDSLAVKKAEEKQLIHFPIRTNEYRYFIGVFQQAGGHPAEAVATFKDALEKDLSLYIAHVRLAEIAESAKDWPTAIAERRNAVNANPDDPSLQMDLGVTMGKAGQFGEAQQALKAAVDGLPRSADAWFWLGVADKQLGHKDEARHDFEQAIAVAPSRMAARANAARAQLASLQ